MPPLISVKRCHSTPDPLSLKDNKKIYNMNPRLI